jgi:hypothetical protein
MLGKLFAKILALRGKAQEGVSLSLNATEQGDTFAVGKLDSLK